MSALRADERGAAMIEAPFAVCIVLLLLMGITTLVQVAWTDLDLSSSVRTATRFASHVDYVPGSGSADRRRTEDEVRQWAAEVAAEADVQPADVTVVGRHLPSGTTAPLDELVAGDEVTVTVTRTVSNALYRIAASVTNAAAHVVGASDVFDPDGVGVKSEATTYVE